MTKKINTNILTSLHWIYNEEKEWNFFEKNSTELDDYLFQLCEH